LLQIKTMLSRYRKNMAQKNYKFYTKEEYQLVADLYGLGRIEKLSCLYRGYGKSLKVAVQTPLGKFVISKNILSNKKSISAKSVESLQNEIDMLKTVKEMPVPRYRPSLKGSCIEKFKDGWVTVYKFFPGEAPKEINPQMVHALGVFLGEFHRRSRKFKKNLISRRRFYDLNPEVMKTMEPFANKQTNSILESVVGSVKQGVENNRPPRKLPRGPIHVDIGPNNEIFIGNRLSAVIDFGNFYIGELMVDVGKTIMFNCCQGGRLNQNLLRKFIKGYESKRKFNINERNYLRKSILYAIYSHIWVDLYHVTIKYVPESYALFLVKSFLPVAKQIEKSAEAF